MKRLLVITMFAIFSQGGLVQDVSAQVVFAAPAGGWDSLKAHISYPELLQRAGIEGCAFAEIRIDSIGTILAPVTIHATHQLFEQVVHNALFQTKWRPALDNGRRISSVIQVPVFFFLNRGQSENRIIIQKDQARIDQ